MDHQNYRDIQTILLSQRIGACFMYAQETQVTTSGDTSEGVIRR